MNGSSTIQQSKRLEQRPIKFRAWSPILKKFMEDGEWELTYDNGKAVAYFSADVESHYLILLEFTGLLDKEGNEIYEGDICQDYEATYRIFWDNEISGFDCERLQDGSTMKGFACYDKTILSDIISECKVIGSIYSTPELLNL